MWDANSHNPVDTVCTKRLDPQTRVSERLRIAAGAGAEPLVRRRRSHRPPFPAHVHGVGHEAQTALKRAKTSAGPATAAAATHPEQQQHPTKELEMQ